MAMTKDDKLRVNFCRIGDRITDFSIQLSSKIDGVWREIMRVDTETHGDKNKEGLAHVHHFYAKRKTWYQELAGSDSFNSIYKTGLKTLLIGQSIAKEITYIINKYMKIKSYQDNYTHFVKKDIALSYDFSEYFVRHEEIFEGLPQNPCIIGIDPNDKKFTKEKIAIGKKSTKGRKCYIAQKSGKEWELNLLK